MLINALLKDLPLKSAKYHNKLIPAEDKEECSAKAWKILAQS